MPAAPATGSRIHAVDALRGIALACMIAFHFSWDLDFFGLTNLGVAEHPGWQWFAKSIAGTFLFTVGVSLYLAHGKRVKWQPFLRRLLILSVAAAAISLSSWYFDADNMIWFGILHCIALSSVLGLAFLNLPTAVIVLAAAAAFAAPHLLTNGAFNHPSWLWLGLSEEYPPAADYIPLLPWFGNVLLGIAVAKLIMMGGLLAKHRRWKPASTFSRALVFAGQHSLIVYLVHQPLMIGLLSLFVQLTG